MPEVIAQDVALRVYLRMVAGRDVQDQIEVRYRRTNTAGMGQLFHTATRADVIADTVQQLGRTTDVYVGCAPRRREHGGVDAIGAVWALWADCDGELAVGSLREFRPSPGVVIRSGSGGNVHAYWPLEAPLLPDHARRANRRLAFRLGADMASTDAARILRPPGTLNHKHEPARPVECIRMEIASYLASEVVGSLEDPPAPSRAPLRAAAPTPDSDDALRTIPTAVYVPALTGRDVGRDGKLTCPFHEDGTPSFQTYPDGGFFCFGCHAGGTIIDFGARLYGIEPRGPGFHEIRRRLAADLLRHAA